MRSFQQHCCQPLQCFQKPKEKERNNLRPVSVHMSFAIMSSQLIWDMEDPESLAVIHAEH